MVNLMAITQVLCYEYKGSLLDHVLQKVGEQPNLRTAIIGPKDQKPKPSSTPWNYGWRSPELAPDERYEQIKQAIVDLLGVKRK
jgi:hypothetical protein